MSEMNRVVITGMGCVTPIGIGLKNYQSALERGISGAGPLTKIDGEGLDVRIACEVEGFEPENYNDPKLIRRTDLFTQHAYAATREAIEDANLPSTGDPTKGNYKLNLREENHKVGVILGTGIGGIETTEKQILQLYNRGQKKVSSLTVPMVIPDAAPSVIALELGIHGNTKTENSACSSTNSAIASAYDALVLGRADVIFSGGSEALITRIGLAAFSRAGALTKKCNDSPKSAYKPFDLNRSGFVMGEGAGIVVMETLEHARKRGAEIYCEVKGYGVSTDAYHLTAPLESGAEAAYAMNMALNMAKINPEQVDYINAHGTSTPLNDSIETRAIKQVFREHARDLHISSTKSMTGHLLGASGAVEFIATTLGMKEGIMYPTINYTTPDPECDLNYVPNISLEKDYGISLLNSFGFGGHNVCLVIGKFED